MRASVLSEPTVLRALAAAGREMSKGCLPPLSILLNPAYKEPVARLVAASVGPVGTARRASARGQEPAERAPTLGRGQVSIRKAVAAVLAVALSRGFGPAQVA